MFTIEASFETMDEEGKSMGFAAGAGSSPALPAKAAPLVTIGDTYVYSDARWESEVLIGFRPGLDRIVLQDMDVERNRGRITLREERGSAVIADNCGRRIVIEGIGVDELKPGDIAPILLV